MKRLFLVFVCAIVVSAVAFSQQGQRGGTPEEQAKRTTDQFKTEFKLTADQVKKVEPINLTYAKAAAKLRENANGDFASIRESMQKLEKDRGTALEKVLTKEQNEAYKKWVANRPQRGQGGGNRPN